jgi:hypothetical protein
MVEEAGKMKQYIKWFKYLMTHKWYVFVDMYKAGYPLAGLIHDWDKLTFYKFVTYANHHYAPDGEPKGHFKTKTAGYKAGETGDEPFDACVLDHLRISEHHWQHYYEVVDYGGFPAEITRMMPHERIVEMMADWRSAAKVQGTDPDMVKWYDQHKDDMKLNSRTREEIETTLNYAEYKRVQALFKEGATTISAENMNNIDSAIAQAEPILKSIDEMQKPFKYDVNDKVR